MLTTDRAPTGPTTSPPAPGAPAVPRGPTAGNRLLVTAIIVLTSILLLTTALGTWVRRQALDTNNWSSASSEVLANPAVQEALSHYVINELYESVDVADQLRQRLPNELDPLAPTLAGALREPATTAVDRLLDSPQVRALWLQLNRRAHATVVRVLEDDTRAGLSTTDGNVTLDVRELVQTIAQRLGLSGDVLDRLPADAGTITLIKSSELANAQRAVRILKFTSAALFVVVVGLFAVAVVLAKGWRRAAVRNIGIALIVVGLTVRVITRLVGDYIVDSVVHVPGNRPAVRAVWVIGTQLLSNIGRNIAIVGVVIVLWALLAGPSRLARRVRAALAPVLGAPPAIVAIGVAVAFLALVQWGPFPMLLTWYGFLVGGLLLLGAAEALRRQVVREKAEAGPSMAPAGA
jgi:hypothetical protein